MINGRYIRPLRLEQRTCTLIANLEGEVGQSLVKRGLHLKRLSDQFFASDLVLRVFDLRLVSDNHDFASIVLDKLIYVPQDCAYRYFATFQIVENVYAYSWLGKILVR